MWFTTSNADSEWNESNIPGGDDGIDDMAIALQVIPRSMSIPPEGNIRFRFEPSDSLTEGSSTDTL